MVCLLRVTGKPLASSSMRLVLSHCGTEKATPDSGIGLSLSVSSNPPGAASHQQPCWTSNCDITHAAAVAKAEGFCQPARDQYRSDRLDDSCWRNRMREQIGQSDLNTDLLIQPGESNPRGPGPWNSEEKVKYFQDFQEYGPLFTRGRRVLQTPCFAFEKHFGMGKATCIFQQKLESFSLSILLTCIRMLGYAHSEEAARRKWSWGPHFRTWNMLIWVHSGHFSNSCGMCVLVQGWSSSDLRDLRDVVVVVSFLPELQHSSSSANSKLAARCKIAACVLNNELNWPELPLNLPSSIYGRLACCLFILASDYRKCSLTIRLEYLVQIAEGGVESRHRDKQMPGNIQLLYSQLAKAKHDRK